MGHTQAPKDLIAQHARLRRRVADLADGVMPMYFYIGAFGLNTNWVRLTPYPGWKYSNAESYVHWRLRSDVVYLETVGSGALTPVSSEGWPTVPAFYIPGKPNVAWPASRLALYCRTTVGGRSTMTVKPDGRIFFSKPTSGRLLKPGSSSWPRG
jgi:hypothetical protein